MTMLQADEPQKHHAEWKKKTDLKGHIVYDSII